MPRVPVWPCDQWQDHDPSEAASHVQHPEGSGHPELGVLPCSVWCPLPGGADRSGKQWWNSLSYRL